jgi:protease I
MSDELKGKRIAFLVAPEGVEQLELTEPWKAVKDAGAQPVLVSTEEGEVQAFNHLDKGDTFPVDETVTTALADDFDGLVLPGGVANPDYLRMQEEVPGWVTAFFGAGKPVAVICHGSWTLIEAGVVSGRKLTSWPSLQTDLRNAGATWVDEEVVVDEGPAGATSPSSVLISSRNPDDLKAFNQAIVQHFG